MHLCGCLMAFRSGNESTVWLFFFPALQRRGERERERDSLLTLSKQTLTLAFAVNRPSNEFLAWSNRVGLSWEDNLMIPSLIKGDPKSNGNVCWREYLKSVLSIRWLSLKVGPFARVDWPSQFITLHRWHSSHRTPQGNTQNNNITAAPYNWSHACCWGCLFGLLDDCLSSAVVSPVVAVQDTASYYT